MYGVYGRFSRIVRLMKETVARRDVVYAAAALPLAVVLHLGVDIL